MTIILATALETHLEVSNNKRVNIHRQNLKAKTYRCGFYRNIMWPIDKQRRNVITVVLEEYCTKQTSC